MLTFRAFCLLEAERPKARPALSLADVKTMLTHVSGDSLQHAAHGGYFIFPDGSVWESRTSHLDAFRPEDDQNTYGTREDELTFWATIKAAHLVLAHTNRAYECQASISAAQADRIVTSYRLTNPPGQEPNMLYIDIQNGGMPVDNKMFTDRVTPDALRAWVNKHF